MTYSHLDRYHFFTFLDDRVVEVVEKMSLFIAVLIYCIGAPLQFITRLPYGYNCLRVVCRYMEGEYDVAATNPPPAKKTLSIIPV